MANPERGEVDLVTPTKVYTLAMQMNGLCDAQAKLQKTYAEILMSIAGMDLVSIRYLLWVFLKKHHSKEFPGPEKVGDFIDDLPDGLADALKALTDLFELNAARGATKPSEDPPAAQM